MSSPENNNFKSGKKFNHFSTKKIKIKKKKTREDRLKERLQSKSTITPFTGDFMNNFCKKNNIPVFQEKWHNVKKEK